MPEPRRRCVLYVRKSTDREDKQILSIPAQLKELREFAMRTGLGIDAELEEAYSAREPGRPVFSQLLGDVAAGRIERVLAWKLDRLARNPIDGGALIHFLGKGHLKEIVTLEGTYTGSGDSKFMLSVLFGAATKMTDDLAMGVRRGNKAVHEKGRITGIPPVGYMKVHDGDGRTGARRVVPDPERFPLVQRGFRDLVRGTFTVAEAWRRAVDDGLTRRRTTNRASVPIGMTHFYKLVQNPFYCGRIVRTGEVFAGEHEPMITPSEFDAVQRVVHRTSTPRPHQNRKHRFLYRGLLRCGDCGRALAGERIKGRFIYYRCTRRRLDRPPCRSPAPREASVTAAIEKSLASVTMHPAVVEWTLRAVDLHIERERARHLRERRHRETGLTTAQAAIDQLTDMRLAGDLTEAEYRARRPVLLARVEELRLDLADPTARLEEWRSFIAQMLHWGETALEVFRTGNEDERRALLAEGYTNLAVHDRILTPELRFPYSVLVHAPKLDAGPAEPYTNRLPPPELTLHRRKNARPRTHLERAFLVWQAKVDEVRTLLSRSHPAVEQLDDAK